MPELGYSTTTDRRSQEFGLNWLLDPVPQRELARCYEKEPLHIPGPPEKFSGLFGWDRFSAALTAISFLLPHRQLRVARQSEVIPVSSYRDVVNHFKDGASIYITTISDYCEPLRTFEASLSREVGKRLGISAVASPPGIRGVNRHFDVVNNVILQIEGRKLWKLFEPRAILPVGRDSRVGDVHDPERIVAEIVLGPGDVLYIPRGMWHEVLPLDEPTLHLDLALKPDTGLDFLEFLLDELMQDPTWRASMPLLLPEVRESTEVSADYLAEHVEALCRDLVGRLADSALPSRYLRDYLKKMPVYEPYNFPFPVAAGVADWAERSFRACTSGLVFYHRDPATETLEVDARGLTFAFPLEYEEVIRFVLSGEPLSIRSLVERYPMLGHEEVRSLLQGFLEAGQLRIV